MARQPTKIIPKPGTVVDLSRRLGAQLDKTDAAAIKRLTDAYYGMYGRVKDKMQLLVDQIMLNEGKMTIGQIQRLAQYKDLMNAIEREMGNYGGYLNTEMSALVNDAVKQATRDARLLAATAAADNGMVLARFNSLNPVVIKSLLNFAQPDSALYKYMAGPELNKELADRIIQTIAESIGLGQNPRVLGRELMSKFKNEMGWTLTTAMRNARTVQIWSYREAARANYIANNDVVEGWIWCATLDDRTCEACWAMHGTEHGLDETLDGHYGDRCLAVPKVIGGKNPLEAGEVEFRKLSEDRQRAILGPGKYDAWSSGKVEFGAFAKNVPDPVYGSMTVAAALKDLVKGDE